MSRVKTGYLFRCGKLVRGLKKERKKFLSNKKRWTKSEMVFVQNGTTKNLGLNSVFFSIVEFLDKNCDEKLHRQSVEKIPK